MILYEQLNKYSQFYFTSETALCVRSLLRQCRLNVIFLRRPGRSRDAVQRTKGGICDVAETSHRLELDGVNEVDALAGVRLRVAGDENVIPEVDLLDMSEGKGGRLDARVGVCDLNDLVELKRHFEVSTRPYGAAWARTCLAFHAESALFHTRRLDENLDNS